MTPEQTYVRVDAPIKEKFIFSGRVYAIPETKDIRKIVILGEGMAVHVYPGPPVIGGEGIAQGPLPGKPHIRVMDADGRNSEFIAVGHSPSWQSTFPDLPVQSAGKLTLTWGQIKSD